MVWLTSLLLLLYVLTFTYEGQEFWEVTKGTRPRIQTAEMRFLQRTAVLMSLKRRDEGLKKHLEEAQSRDAAPRQPTGRQLLATGGGSWASCMGLSS